MYNPVSVLHTVKKVANHTFDTAVFTLGTNHVYVERATGEIVDNCQKRPQREFEERELTVEECADALREAITLLRQANPKVNIIITVSPIRYAKYGYHGSQLSKAVLLLATDKVIKEEGERVYYFPAYEIVNDELRDYRFYKADMLHPNEQAVEYIWEQLVATCFSAEAKQFMEEWRPIKEALAHRPFHPEAAAYQDFIKKQRKSQDVGTKISQYRIEFITMEEMNDKQIEALLKAHGIRLTANRILIARTLSGLDNPASIKEIGSKDSND